MTELILHHYDTSPFAQKVRWTLGLKGLEWHSVDVPSVMPKPDVVALTGGYRRTPFMQIGADIYCDTALICDLLEERQPQPTLYPASAGGLQRAVAAWADSALFWAAIPHAMQPAGAPHITAHLKPEELKVFGADRVAMTANRPRINRTDCAAQLDSHLHWIDLQLADGRAFLMGAEPGIADLSVAHSIWFLRRAGPVAEVLTPFAHLCRWYERVLAFGQGRPREMSSAEAIEIAATAGLHAPVRVEPGLGFEPGVAVTIAASDYATDPVPGTLVGLNAREAVIERHDDRAGTVHVHFPRIGYLLRKRDL